MLLRLEIDDWREEIHASVIDADLASGIVLPCNYTDNDILEYCNTELAAPDCGDFNNYDIIRED